MNQDTYGTIEDADVTKGKEYSNCFCVSSGDSNYLLESMTIWIKNFGQKIREKQEHIAVNITIFKGKFSIRKKKNNLTYEYYVWTWAILTFHYKRIINSVKKNIVGFRGTWM